MEEDKPSIHGDKNDKIDTDDRCLPWKNGYYKLEGINNVVYYVDGENVKKEGLVDNTEGPFSSGTWKFGNFGEAHPEVTKYTKRKTNDVEINLGMIVTKGVLSEDGTKITIWSITNEVASFIKMSENEYIDFKNSADPADAPSHHYKIQPEFQGKLIFISGAPGLGKSTAALSLSQQKEYVYYEGDAFGAYTNPYIPPNVKEPSLATWKQKPLKDVPQDRVDAINNGQKEMMKFMRKEEYDDIPVKRVFSALCKDIKSERKRIGGDWVVAKAIPTRVLRDHIKTQLPEAFFIVLNMSKDDQKKRILKRHGEGGRLVDALLNIYDLYETVAEGEKDAANLFITNDMSREDVLYKILELIPK